MGLFFKSDKHLFSYFEKSSIEKKFLNILKLVKSKNIEFLSRYENDENSNYSINYHTLRYDYLILRKKVIFTATKVIIFSQKQFENRYNSFASYLMLGKYYEGKLNKGGDSFIGLPEPISDNFPYTILELESLIINKKNYKKNVRLREYLILLNRKNSWRKEVEKGFNKISDKVIKETFDHLNIKA